MRAMRATRITLTISSSAERDLFDLTGFLSLFWAHLEGTERSALAMTNLHPQLEFETTTPTLEAGGIRKNIRLTPIVHGDSIQIE